ncbi:hypothetical protein [Cognatilysobacter lacus]|uniref:Uncharacterized protein n=1 Tax=Cognatilysobacter lacus TaxID=1643323 RepID=A0A5D8YC33_9GAMM|nr:hypothetical protein [Lysobacter lacus]TZF80338.1 hypothetical protein FW784_14085 [Lysobacter lacus]
MLFNFLAAYILVTGMLGTGSRLYIAACKTSTETIDHSSFLARAFWRYQVFSSCLLGSFFISPVFLYFVSWGSLRGTDTAALLYIALLMPLAFLWCAWDFSRLRKADQRKIDARDAFMRRR